MALKKVTKVREIAECDDDSDVVDIHYDKIVGQSDAAILVEVEEEEIWIPKSQINDVDLKKHVLTIKEWIAIEKDLI